MSLHPKILPTNERPLADNGNPIFILGEVPYYLTLVPDDYCSSTPEDTSSDSDTGM